GDHFACDRHRPGGNRTERTGDAGRRAQETDSSVEFFPCELESSAQKICLSNCFDRPFQLAAKQAYRSGGGGIPLGESLHPVLGGHCASRTLFAGYLAGKGRFKGAVTQSLNQLRRDRSYVRMIP